MRKVPLLCALFLLLPTVARPQTSTLRLHFVLVDGKLDQKPVPRLLVRVQALDGAAEPTSARTGFDGIAELTLPPGRYRITTPEGIVFQGKNYAWTAEVSVPATSTLEFSNDNAVTSTVDVRGRKAPADLVTQFRRYQNSVVTVWSEFGHGTGFIVDREQGLVLTNQHVVGTSDLVSVQFDERRKVEAKVVTFDAERDVAVLWARLDAFPEAIAARLAASAEPAPKVEVGDTVFTIGSPLNQKKIMAAGIVSGVEARAIFSDIPINHGNSGGPLMNMDGLVLGLTTFGDIDETGGAIAGIVRIEQARLALERARAKLGDIAPPDAGLLPVEPPGSFPLDELKNSISDRKFDAGRYIFKQGDYDVAVVTPVLKYRLTEGAKLMADQQKQKRTTRTTRAIEETFRPLDDMKSWAEYVGEYKPVIEIEATPRLGRNVKLFDFSRLKSKNPDAIRLRFKSDFYRMKLFCGQREVAPIQPGKISMHIDYHTQEFEIADVTYRGFYSYPYDAISAECPDVTLQIFSEQEPEKPITKVLDPKTVARVVADFAPVRKVQGALLPGAGSEKK